MTVDELIKYLQNYPLDMEVRFVDGVNDYPIHGLTKFNYQKTNEQFCGLYD